MNEAPFSGGWDEENLKKLKIQQTHTQKSFGHRQTHTACLCCRCRDGRLEEEEARRQTDTERLLHVWFCSTAGSHLVGLPSLIMQKHLSPAHLALCFFLRWSEVLKLTCTMCDWSSDWMSFDGRFTEIGDDFLPIFSQLWLFFPHVHFHELFCSTTINQWGSFCPSISPNKREKKLEKDK